MNHYIKRINQIKEIFIFENLSFKRLISIVQYTSVVEFRKNAKIFSENDDIDNFAYILLEGQIGVQKRKRIDLETYEEIPIKFKNHFNDSSSSDNETTNQTDIEKKLNSRNSNTINNKLL